MPVPLPLVVSPYELDARGVVADVALLLGEPAITLLPAPFEGVSRDSINAAAASAPEFARLIGRWSWMQDLWRAGTLRPDFAGIDPLELVRETEQSIRSEPGFAGLSSLMRRGVFDSTHEYLRALCRDIPLGGAEPAVTVPVSVGLSRFAHAIDAPLVQQHAKRSAGSIVQQLETRAMRTVSRLAIPIPRDADTDVILELRAAMAEPLGVFRRLIRDGTNENAEELVDFEQAFARTMREVGNGFGLTTTPRRGSRLSMVLISSASMPENATMAAAVRASTLASSRRSTSRAVHAQSANALASRPLRILSVRELPWQDRA